MKGPWRETLACLRWLHWLSMVPIGVLDPGAGNRAGMGAGVDLLASVFVNLARLASL